VRKALTMLAAIAALTACTGQDSGQTTAQTTSPAAAAPAADDVDVTADLKTSAQGASWADLIQSATKTEEDRVEVSTSITDPRGDAGSPGAQQAIQVCEGAVAWLAASSIATPKVSVLEADGSTFVVAGHPTYGPGCTEV
jgi:hypothetical protein